MIASDILDKLQRRVEFEDYCREGRAPSKSDIEVGEVVNILGNYPLLVNPMDKSVGANIYRDGLWEFWITKVICNMIRPGDICVDVGANFGYYSVLMAACTGETGRVYAFEPQQDLAEMIKRSCELNMFSQICVYDFALSDVDDVKTLRIPYEYGGDASLEYDPKHDFRSVDVVAHRFDSLVMSGGRVDVVKVDAEGSEEKIWDGMTNAITKNYSIKIFMEWSNEHLSDAESFIDDIYYRGFRTFEITTNSHLSEMYKNDLLGLDSIEMVLIMR